LKTYTNISLEVLKFFQYFAIHHKFNSRSIEAE
jgi:hypothetical protein